MITAAKISRYRGISDLVVESFGRVNLIIGKNDCGKTALMEALQVGDNLQDAAHHLYLGQKNRLGRGVKSVDFEQFWRPMFFNLDAKLGLSISVTNGQGTWSVLDVRQGTSPVEVIADSDEDLPADNDGSRPEQPSWRIDLHLRTGSIETRQRITATSSQLHLPPVRDGRSSCWISASASVGQDDVRHVSELKQIGRDDKLLELLRQVDGRLSSIELLAPRGDTAELFVHLTNGTPLLPVALMGEGFQRCFELGAAAAANDWPTMFIEEIENGIHHLVLEPLWRWIGMISRERNLQVFATTHSEECIHAALSRVRGARRRRAPSDPTGSTRRRDTSSHLRSSADRDGSSHGHGNPWMRHRRRPLGLRCVAGVRARAVSRG